MFFNQKLMFLFTQVFSIQINLVGKIEKPKIEKPKIKDLSNIELLHEVPFYDELSVVEISKAFKRYARSYKVEIIDSKDPLAQLEASKSSIEDLFKDLLNETKGFKYQITVKVLLCKYRINEEKELAPVLKKF